MIVSVNGTPTELAAGATVATVLAGLELPGSGGRGVAVAVGAEVVPRPDWERRALAEGDHVEILTAIQGG